MFDNRSMRHDCFKEAVCINTKRVYDACRDRTCLDEQVVIFNSEDQEIINHALSVRLKSAEAADVFINVEELLFETGYYTVDLNIYFDVAVDVLVEPNEKPVQLHGFFNTQKRAVLFGSEGKVKTFSTACGDRDNSALPIVTVQIATPVPLGARLVNVHGPVGGPVTLPNSICKRFPGTFEPQEDGNRVVEVDLGVFMLIQLEREVQMLIPVYDFCMPEKICDEDFDQKSSCEFFEKISFPTDAFFPRPARIDECCDCGCKKE